MKVATISVPLNPPRNPELYRIDFRRGLWALYFFGSFFSLGSAGVLITATMPPYEPGLIVFKILFGVPFFGFFAYWFLSKAIRRYRERITVFREGILRKGTAIHHGRKFVPWRSTRHYTVTVRIALDEGSIDSVIVNWDRSIYERVPLGAHVYVFIHPETLSVFIPAEIGVAIRF